jgi:hypothetical protein
VGFNITDQQLFRFFIFVRYRGEGVGGHTMRHYISYSKTSRKPMIQLGGKYFTVFS